MARRRGRGEGSISQRADGRWMGRVEVGWEDGKRRRVLLRIPGKRGLGLIRKAHGDAFPGRLFQDERSTPLRKTTSLKLLNRQCFPSVLLCDLLVGFEFTLGFPVVAATQQSLA